MSTSSVVMDQTMVDAMGVGEQSRFKSSDSTVSTEGAAATKINSLVGLPSSSSFSSASLNALSASTDGRVVDPPNEETMKMLESYSDMMAEMVAAKMMKKMNDTSSSSNSSSLNLNASHASVSNANGNTLDAIREAE